MLLENRVSRGLPVLFIGVEPFSNTALRSFWFLEYLHEVKKSKTSKQNSVKPAKNCISRKIRIESVYLEGFWTQFRPFTCTLTKSHTSRISLFLEIIGTIFLEIIGTILKQILQTGTIQKIFSVHQP